MLKLTGEFTNQYGLTHYDNLTVMRFKTSGGMLNILLSDDQYLNNFVLDTQPQPGSRWELLLWEDLVPQLNIMVFRLSSARKLENSQSNPHDQLNQDFPSGVKEKTDKRQAGQKASESFERTKQQLQNQQQSIKHHEDYVAKPQPPIRQFDTDNDNDKGVDDFANDYDAAADLDQTVKADQYQAGSQYQNYDDFDMRKRVPKKKTPEDDAVQMGDADDIAKGFSKFEKDETSTEASDHDEDATTNIPHLDI
ncbi:hypothetical protein [uncultured Limosilactobacillus sp.]|uniref:hypothetical protein n=1 Tax=uncultured Limosilactobacillus sp. TaxID=2837629 RepID=UPI0025EEC83D|nr:hypothetical protein [uncultured Limosilactobacillus sp.]